MAFDVGGFPIGVVSDGTNIWVANGGSNTATKLRASDGAVLGTFSVGKFPIGVAFDGTNIWVANGESNNVMKLRTTDGAVLGTFTLEQSPLWWLLTGRMFGWQMRRATM
jgi:DNA-binding beta-propeller fold protein YncE